MKYICPNDCDESFGFYTNATIKIDAKLFLDANGGVIDDEPDNYSSEYEDFGSVFCDGCDEKIAENYDSWEN